MYYLTKSYNELYIWKNHADTKHILYIDTVLTVNDFILQYEHHQIDIQLEKWFRDFIIFESEDLDEIMERAALEAL